jgi:hypothetical protein
MTDSYRQTLDVQLLRLLAPVLGLATGPSHLGTTACHRCDPPWRMALSESPAAWRSNRSTRWLLGDLETVQAFPQSSGRPGSEVLR